LRKEPDVVTNAETNVLSPSRDHTIREDWVLRMPWSERHAENPEPLVTREWLVANGLGGFASGTVAGVAARRYHGLLIAALPSPLGRCVMLNHMMELIRLPNGETFLIGGEERHGELLVHGVEQLREFRLEMGLPVWRYELNGFVMEKRLLLPHRQNTVQITYRLLEGEGPLRIKLRPSVHFRRLEEPVSTPHSGPLPVTCLGQRIELCSKDPMPCLRMQTLGERSAFTLDGIWLRDILYRVEERRGYDAKGEMWSPGYFRASLTPDDEVSFVASTEEWEQIDALPPHQAYQLELTRREHLIDAADSSVRRGKPSKLVLAADQFLITPTGRVADEVRTHAMGDEVRTVIAGYHWFTDWGRDTMISLEGLTLTTGRYVEAGYILRTFGQYIRDGLIPNFFPDGENEGLYHTADATLWFFHALQRYVQVTKDRTTLRQLLPKLRDVVEHHLRGTKYGIKVDRRDGLLSQGEEGYQLTWMDAKVEGWVVTPRRGKAVEINALWYNALRLLESWLGQEDEAQAAGEVKKLADQAYASFNERFWNPQASYLFDVIDGPAGNDDALRPNQVFAISLDHPVLERSGWEPVMEVVTRELLTPVGLRSLGPHDPDYKPQYFGDLRTRDAAYHQGTVWGWLIGPYVDAFLATWPDKQAKAREHLTGLLDHMDEACIGSLSEIFDAEEPYIPRGCIAQAWSVAEVLRCWAKTES
jgi:predicted glycogen debranching enzyme